MKRIAIRLLWTSLVLFLLISGLNVAHGQQGVQPMIAAEIQYPTKGAALHLKSGQGIGNVPSGALSPTQSLYSEYHNQFSIDAPTANLDDDSCRCCRQRLQDREVFNRELPTGDMVARIPYVSRQSYYYHHPYNQNHVSSQGANWPTTADQSNRYPYSRTITHQLNQQNVDEAETDNRHLGEEKLVEDGFLEFSDWRTHRAARREFEGTSQSTGHKFIEARGAPLAQPSSSQRYGRR